MFTKDISVVWPVEYFFPGRRRNRPIPERLFEKSVRADQAQRWPVRGRRSADGFRPDRRTLLELPITRRHAGHCDDGQGHRQRVSDGCRRHDARDCALVECGISLQHVWRQSRFMCRGFVSVKGKRTASINNMARRRALESM